MYFCDCDTTTVFIGLNDMQIYEKYITNLTTYSSNGNVCCRPLYNWSFVSKWLVIEWRQRAIQQMSADKFKWLYYG